MPGPPIAQWRARPHIPRPRGMQEDRGGCLCDAPCGGAVARACSLQEPPYWRHALRLKRLVVSFTTLSLLASAFVASQGVVSAGDSSSFSLDETYINYAAPDMERQTSGKEVKGKGGVYGPKGSTALDQANALDR